MDPAQSAAGAVQRVATGAYQIGFADVNSTIEYNAKNPGKKSSACSWPMTSRRSASMP